MNELLRICSDVGVVLLALALILAPFVLFGGDR